MRPKFFTLLMCFGLAGCASVYSVSMSPKPHTIYGGVRLDAHILGSSTANGVVPCGLGLPGCQPPEAWLLMSGALFDLPFSFIIDTVLLPYTIIATATAPESAQRDGPAPGEAAP